MLALSITKSRDFQKAGKSTATETPFNMVFEVPA
jgi:hypothetical protein